MDLGGSLSFVTGLAHTLQGVWWHIWPLPTRCQEHSHHLTRHNKICLWILPISPRPESPPAENCCPLSSISYERSPEFQPGQLELTPEGLCPFPHCKASGETSTQREMAPGREWGLLLQGGGVFVWGCKGWTEEGTLARKIRQKWYFRLIGIHHQNQCWLGSPQNLKMCLIFWISVIYKKCWLSDASCSNLLIQACSRKASFIPCRNEREMFISVLTSKVRKFCKSKLSWAKKSSYAPLLHFAIVAGCLMLHTFGSRTLLSA